uniref:carbonic anhydrase n=1 Tax=Heterorhabditis bacteriophora TaxID=37862 RepID=A0A1I7W9R3_HETBA
MVNEDEGTLVLFQILLNYHIINYDITPVFGNFISRNADIEITHWEPLHFNDYNVQGNIEAENNGHTELVQGFKSWSARPSISGGGLGSRYFLSQFHFHWDGNDRFGSEHTLNGLHYPLEVPIHFVHIREDLNESNADLIPGGIAVVNKSWETFLDLKENLQWYSPNSLLPKDRSTFFRYNGIFFLFVINLFYPLYILQMTMKVLKFKCLIQKYR